jgi:UDP-glucose 4-epimerase
LNILGGDYNMHGGTAVRDCSKVVGLLYIRLRPLHRQPQVAKCSTIHTGIGFRVLNVARDFKQDSGKLVLNRMKSHHSRGIATCYSDSYLVFLGLRSEPALVAWFWQYQNPQDYLGA